MKLTPVESSHIAAVGYLEDERVLLVRYRDGALYAWPGWNSVAYENLQRAPSKGKALKACAGPSILITKGDVRPGGNDAAPSGPLNVIDEDADKCCQKGLTEFLNAEELIVPWSEDPKENARNINAATAEAEATGRNLRWSERPYRLNGVAAVPDGNDAAPSGPLNVIDEDADKCCVAGLNVHINTPRVDDFECQSCGTRLHLESFETSTICGKPSPMRYWRIVPYVAIVRPNR